MNLKKYIVSFLAICSLLISCNLEEHPTFPSAESLFSTSAGANTVLNGVFSDMKDYRSYGAIYYLLTGYGSGLFNTNKDDVLTTIAGFKPLSSEEVIEVFWRGSYMSIGRTNDLIDGLSSQVIEDEKEKDNILGQAYFLRAFCYFNLVRIYGGVPLITKVVTTSEMNYPRATEEAIYDQIISDAEMAKQLLPKNGSNTPGRPASEAASMLLAKVYMQLAGNQTAGETDNWQKAYNEAMEVYGKYSLVENYRSLWYEETGNNTSESIFEIQANVENRLRLVQIGTASNGLAGRNSWGRLKPNLECYDMHEERYPGDPRFESTFVTEYTQYNSNGTTTFRQTYPFFKNRNDKPRSYPWLFKYYIKNTTAPNCDTGQNWIAFRYAELLLMLAEIKNELSGPNDAYQYVNEVLARARNSAQTPTAEPADWSGMNQEEFRDAIMFEYRYELLGEGQDYFKVRRRGYEHFKKNVIEIHNSHPGYDFSKSRDILYPDNSRIMLMPISQSEIIANPNISIEDQNPGY
ncbi:Starch-binding associating with outer membrane [Mariniphaga anaerophila]|uniref:Starch-binding associating with outer membrane n=1 Tax=Mariniphaga anaerophila TaxID=1484053 RepID=A0A1M4ZTX3_9BACT|nr:RagB/SusD family nutrient uptake outer membrane protein [Mariniphaga anaerophila]SHF21232.1 Starch-binding associating with outer membrane [Mariniphaga anaerophila]